MKDLFTEEELAKLPKWAKSKVATIIRENRELEEAIEELQGNVTDDTYSTVLKSAYGPNGGKAVRQSINGSSGIDIKLPGSEARINVRLKEGQLFLNASGYPSTLAIVPQASNVVQVAVIAKPWELGD